MKQYSRIFALLTLVALPATVGCGASAPAPLRVRYAGLQHEPSARNGQAMIVEFEPGDRIPIELHFSDDAFDLTPAAPLLELVARRRCFVFIGAGRLRTSLSGRGFDTKPKVPGRFRVQLELTHERRRLLVEVATPQHASEPSGTP